MTGPQGSGSAQDPSAQPTIGQLCALAQVSRAAYYRHWGEHIPLVQQTALQGAIQRLALEHRHYGYRRITALLKREGWLVNHKRVARILREDNLLCLRKPLFRPATTDARHSWIVWPNLARHLRPMAVNPLWVADITYVWPAARSFQALWSTIPTAASSTPAATTSDASRPPASSPA